MQTLAIIGSGHLGQQIAHYAISDGHFKNVVFFDDFAEEKFRTGFQILGKSDKVEDAFAKKLFDKLVIGIGYNHLKVRKEMFERFQSKIPFATIIHSSVWKDSTAIIESGCVIYPGSLIDANVTIKANTILNVSCTIAHDTIIGSHCFLSPRVAVAGFVKVDDLCILGINATIIDSINIVAMTQVGGATAVIKNLEDAGLYVGNPARFIRTQNLINPK